MNERTNPEPGQARLTAARLQPPTQWRLSDRLKTVSIVILLCALCALVAYHAGKPANASTAAMVRPLNAKEVRHRLLALEEEVQLLKADLIPEKEPQPLLDGLAAGFKFFEDHSTLLALVGGIGFALFIYFYFGIDYYFGSYREIANKKKLSDFHRELGDRLMILTEWDSAEAAYRDALEINPTDIAASLGIAKASVFQPLKGQTYSPPYLIEIKLDSLIANTPGRDAQLVFLKGVNRRSQGHEAESRALFQEAIAIDPNFVGSYILLGFSLMGESEIKKAFGYFQQAVALDRGYPFATANLGICYLLTLQFDQAIQYFELAQQGSPLLFTAIVQGDAHRYHGSHREALRLHSYAIEVLSRKDIESDRYVSGEWLRNFMPLEKDDSTTIRRSVRAVTFAQKKTIALYALAIDRALNGELPQASQAYAEAAALDNEGTYLPFVANQIQSTLQLATVTIPPAANTWLNEKLSPNSAHPPG